MNSEIIQANIKVHTIMADSYNQEPHFRPENQRKVKENLRQLRKKGGQKLLDLGCGTGFIIHLAADLFSEIHGVDVTQAMMDKIDTSLGNIVLHNTPAQTLPFADACFDVVTAYSFLHHLEDYRPVLQEAFRVMKQGGQFYIDLEPNKLFWENISEIAHINDEQAYSEIVNKEVVSVLHTDDKVEEQFGIEKDVFNKAEYIKNILGGIDPGEFKQACLDIGFSRCDVRFEWFLGQGKIMHEQPEEHTTAIEQYLHQIHPISAPLFKYLRFDLVK